MTLKYVADIEVSTGKILNAAYPQHVIPAEGIVGNIQHLYITEAIWDSIGCDTLHNFLADYRYNTSTSTFVETGRPTNRHAIWDNSTNTWTWDSALLLNDIRKERTKKLYRSDWALGPDSPLTDSQKTEVTVYRRYLRDWPNTLDMTTISSVDDVTWPTLPDCLG